MSEPTLHRAENGEYRATTPAGNQVEIFRAWTCPQGGWMITRTDETPIGNDGETAIHVPSLGSARSVIGLGFADPSSN